MNLLSHLKYWTYIPVEKNGDIRRLYVPTDTRFLPEDIELMKRGKAPIERPLQVHHMGKSDKNFALLSPCLHQGQEPILCESFKAKNPNYKGKSPYRILHSCPPIKEERLEQLNSFLNVELEKIILDLKPILFELKKELWGFVPSAKIDAPLKRLEICRDKLDAHQEPSKAKHDVEFDEWKVVIWQFYATCLEAKVKKHNPLHPNKTLSSITL
ncbi:MAG: HNH/ENDO VII family nuclease [Vampirovibrionales bacterium]|jgi:hypothetical protein|nr:HNH/ENDO VII family nuclease [Vampirovibrionales bacterium]